MGRKRIITKKLENFYNWFEKNIGKICEIVESNKNPDFSNFFCDWLQKALDADNSQDFQTMEVLAEELVGKIKEVKGESR